MKLPVIIIIGVLLGLYLQRYSSPLFIQKPAEVITVPQIEEKPPLDAEIIAQIAIEFAEHDKWVIMQAIEICKGESGCTWNRVSKPNTNGSIDYGTFQINSVHIKRFGDKFTYDWKENIKVAHILYDEQGWRPWVVARKLGYL